MGATTDNTDEFVIRNSQFVIGLTPDERIRLAHNIRGYDISPDMVRLSLVNLYLHGFTDPHIVEYDTLTSDEKWNEVADVILVNPPFMSPKGGIKPHKRFSVQVSRSGVLFVDYMAEHLTATGRAAIVVPEGDGGMAQAVERRRIGANGDFNLSGERYLTAKSSTSSYPMVPLSSVCNLVGGATPSKANESYWTNGAVKWISSRHIDGFGNVVGNDWISESAVAETSTGIAPTGLVILISRVSVGKFAFAIEPYAINQDLTAVIPKDKSILDSRFLFCVARELASIIETNAQGIGVRGVTRAFLGELAIPLPPLEVQHQIVSEIEGYQRIIDGARQVLDNYKPHIVVSPEWELCTLGDVCTQITDGTHQTPTYVQSGVPFLRVTDLTGSSDSKKFITEEEHAVLTKRCRPRRDDVLYSKNGTIGVAKRVDWDYEFSIFVSLSLLKPKRELVEPQYLETYLNSVAALAQAGGYSKSGTVTNLHLVEIRQMTIPLLDLETQRTLVAEIEAEQALVAANRELIRRMEAKVKAAIDRVWGS